MNRATAVAATALAALLVFGVVSGPVSGHSAQVKEQTIVTVGEDGDAGVEVIITYDLSDESEAQSFEEMQANEVDRRNELRDSVTRQLESSVSSSDASLESLSFEETRTYEDDNMGAIVFTGKMTNVAEKTDEGINVTAFDGHEPPREFIVQPPEGYEIASADAHTPQPYIIINNEAVYEPGTDLTGYELVIMEGDGASGNGGGSGGMSLPVVVGGFAIAIAVGGGVAVALRRQ